MAKGLCQKHYDIFRRPRKGRFSGTDESRFWGMVDKVSEQNTGGCWIWTGSFFGGKNYGQFHVRRKPEKNWRAHRFSYTITKGEIPKGMTLDHLCMNPSCVNPDHLEPVTQTENNRRKPKQLICGRGHLRVPGTRRCKICSTKCRPGRSPESRRGAYLRRKARKAANNGENSGAS